MKRYQIIYADPPWPHRSGSRNKVVPYPVMSTQSICNLAIKTIIRKDAILFLWTTDKYLPIALQVIQTWGFTYRTVAFNWVKKTKNGKPWFIVGGWTVKSTELCLLATKGRPHKLLKRRKGIHQLVEASIGKHSAKPFLVRKRIELMFGPLAKKIELFAREKHPGWDVWGNEVESDVKL